MNTYLTALGWWNLVGCIFMLAFFNENFGKKVLNDWTQIFNTPYKVGYWEKFWLSWVIGLNIFFALVNIFAAQWELNELKILCVVFDILAYLLFILLTIWGVISKRTGAGIYSVFVIFIVWLFWGIISLIKII